MPMCLHETIPCCHCAACCSCLAGGIMELNQRLVASPDLLRTHAETTGYVAIMTPMKKDRMLALARTMVTRPMYEALRAGGERPSDLRDHWCSHHSTAPRPHPGCTVE